MSGSKGPSVISKVIMAFLLPLLVFIGTLAIFQKIVKKITEAKNLQTLLAFLLALTVTLSFILLIRIISKRLRKHL